MKRKVLVWLLVLVLAWGNLPAFAAMTEGEIAADDFQYVRYLIDALYYEEVDTEALLLDTIAGYIEDNPELLGEMLTRLLGNLDENSGYLNEGESAAMDILQTGEIYGIGITVGEKGEGLLVQSPIDGGPAERAGIRAGDLIMTIDGRSVAGFDQNTCISMLRGELGTEVTVGIRREGEPELLTFTLVRAPVHAVEVGSHMVTDEIGYLKIYSFTTGVAADVESQLAALQEAGAKSLILDLRDNLGGVTTEAIAVANLFLPKDAVIVTEQYRDPELTQVYTADGTGEDWPMVVLINENTASASEILCGALKQNEAATVVGQTSYGKGSMQVRVKLNETESVKITVGHYLIPGDVDIHKKGIVPDEKVKNRLRPVDIDNDFSKLDITRRLTVGDEGDDVYAVEEYLDAMGYGTGEIDGVFDTYTAQAVWSFQRENDLFPYGVADFTTQLNLSSILQGMEILEDRQFDRAVEILEAF